MITVFKDMCNLCIFTFDCIVRRSDLLRINQAAPCRLLRLCYYFGGHWYSFFLFWSSLYSDYHQHHDGRAANKAINQLFSRPVNVDVERRRTLQCFQLRLLKDVLSANLNQDGDDEDDDDDDDNYVDDGVVDEDGYYDSYYEDEVDGECKVHSNDLNYPNNRDGDDDATINLRTV